MNRPSFLLSTLFILIFCGAKATHLRSGEIRVKQLSADNLTVEITIQVYTNTVNTNVLFGGKDDWLNFGDGTKIEVPETMNIPVPPAGSGIGTAFFTIKHTYAAYGAFTISYSEANRNAGILNMDASVNTQFYVETFITLKAGMIYRAPEFLLPSLHYAKTNSIFTESLGCTDNQGYQLLYEAVIPKYALNTNVINYRFPEKYTINKFNGLLTWDTKFNGSYTAGEYAFAVKVYQLTPAGEVMGFIIRDFQIILEDGPGTESIDGDIGVDENNRIYIPENESMQLLITASAEGTSKITFACLSELSQANDAFQFSSYETTSAGRLLKVGTLKLSNPGNITRDLPYLIAIRVTLTASGVLHSKDFAYLLYTKDTELVDPRPVPEIPVGIEDEHHTCTAFYPNPVQDYLYFKSNLHNEAHFEIRDLSGKVIQEGSLQSPAVDLQSVSPGTYIITVREKGHRSVAKIIKQ
jgi:hypothetical protein